MKAQIGRYGLERDYRGAHCTLEYGGRTLLGTIVDVCPDEYLCTVQHFNGEMWPINPSLGRLEILERALTSATPKPRAGEHTAQSQELHTPQVDAAAFWIPDNSLLMRKEQVVRAYLARKLEAERDALKERVKELTGALEKIASCHSAFDGDVVSIAYKALAKK